MAHEHRSGKGNCDCDCHEHSTRNTYVYMPSSVNYGPPCRITGSEINWLLSVLFGIYLFASVGFEGIMLLLLWIFGVLITLVAVIWWVCAIAKALRRLRKGIRLSKDPYDYLYAGKKQKPKKKRSEAGFALFLTTAMVLCVLIDRFYF